MAEVAQILDVGTEVAGRVRHVGIYGALVDIGTGQDALLHISQLSNGEERRFEEVVQADSEITAYVYKTRQDGFVALTMEKPPLVPWQSIKQGNVYTGEVIRVENFGVFIDFGAERPGMVHVSRNGGWLCQVTERYRLCGARSRGPRHQEKWASTSNRLVYEDGSRGICLR